MVDKTYEEARLENELVVGTPGLNQEQLQGSEVMSATSVTSKDSGIRLSTLREWVITTFPSGVMLESVYDTNGNSIADAAERVDDGGGNSATAAEITGHIGDVSIHAALNDLIISAAAVWSSSKIDTELALKANNNTVNNHIGAFNNPHNVTHAQLPDGGSNTHTQIDSHLSSQENPHQVTHAQLLDGGVNSHTLIDIHIGSTGNPHNVTHAQLEPLATYNHSQIDGHINSVSNPHNVTAAQVSAAPDTHVGDTSHLTVDERSAMTNVSQPLNAGNPFATMADIPVGTGHVIQDEGVDLAQRPNLNFVGPTVTVTDDPSAPSGSATKVEISASGDVTGPVSSADSNLAAFDGVNGKVLKDAGYAMPASGGIGQVLGKVSAADYDWGWIDVAGGGGIPEAPNDSFGYLREGATNTRWVRGSRVFTDATDPSAQMAVGDVWIPPA